MGRAWPGMSQWIVLEPPLEPIELHGSAREAGGPLQHGRRHDSLRARSIQSEILLWSCIKYSNIMVIIFCWFNNSYENKVFTCFFYQWVVHGMAG
jgi:hypothetical protein